MPSPSRRPMVAVATAALVLLPAGLATAAGPPLGSFVPDGFRAATTIRADIGGTPAADAVLVLVATPGTPQDDGGPARAARRLVLLKARADGGFVQIGEGRRILLCTRCGGAFFGVARTPVTVRVRDGVVTVAQESGSRTVTSQRFRIRSEGATGTRLIGVDVRTRDRLTGAEVASRTNLLTGAREVVRTAADGRRTVRRTTVPVRVTPLEAVVAARYR